MKIKITLMLSILLVSTAVLGQVQTAEELQNKYWSYRHKLKTEYLKIGAEPGHSLPAYQRNYFQECGDVDGNISFGDGVIDLGEYIAVLATEYKLLNDQNQDVTATANELYYALNAVDRLDLFWERYFNRSLSTGSANGFFVRDDYHIISNNQKKSALELFCCFT
tara:strand:- start:344 stop:838 length:495 start_codon:yes stop_codon:yes gene_type:complete